MTSKDKLIDRFKSLPKDFTFEELVKLLGLFGFEQSNKGKTSGSRVRFMNMDNLEYKGYYGPVEYSKADNGLFGKVLGMTKNSITYEGITLDELKSDFEAGVDSYLEGCDELGVKRGYPSILL